MKKLTREELYKIQSNTPAFLKGFGASDFASHELIGQYEDFVNDCFCSVFSIFAQGQTFLVVELHGKIV